MDSGNLWRGGRSLMLVKLAGNFPLLPRTVSKRPALALCSLTSPEAQLATPALTVDGQRSCAGIIGFCWATMATSLRGSAPDSLPPTRETNGYTFSQVALEGKTWARPRGCACILMPPMSTVPPQTRGQMQRGSSIQQT